MITRLKRKQGSDNADWVDVWNHIEEYVSRDELDSAVATAIADIRRATAGKNAIYGWSGGKDSLALSQLCREAGVEKCIFTRTNLEYPAFERWAMEHLPPNCTVNNLGYDLDWLAQNPDMLFPDAKHDQLWHKILQIRGYEEAHRSLNPDLIITGHRVADGNIVGRDGFIRKQSGEVRFAPLAAWPHEMVLAYLHYNRLELPPIYGWKLGWVYGTHTWPERGGKEDRRVTWGEVYDIDRSIVYNAAEKLDSARKFLLWLEVTNPKGFVSRPGRATATADSKNQAPRRSATNDPKETFASIQARTSAPRKKVGA